MKVKSTTKFDKDLDDFTLNELLLETIYLAIKNMEEANKPQDIHNIRKMTGFKSYYRVKIGSYRIGIKIENSIIELARVAHRSKIYKVFP